MADNELEKEVADDVESDAYSYTINIFTGNEWGAGTDANVHVTIYGTKGDSGEHQFQNEGSTTFEGGMKNAYSISTREPLGTLYKVRVGHDNTGWGPGWFLDKIEVEDGSNGEVVEFTCGKWLATDSEDGLIRRDLMREGFVEEVDSPHESVSYTVNILTGNEWGAGTDSNILFTLYGSAGESEQQTIENEGSTTFECGMTDTYTFECPYLGTLAKIRIGHDNTGWGPAWYLDKVTIEDPKNDETVVFPCYRWLATNADDGMIERELVREGMFGENIIIEGLTEDMKGEPLGMESREIKDDKITASSHAEDTPPSCARINNDVGWCAKEAEGSWLQVDLDSVHCVMSVATQGNPGGNQDYVKKYKIQYSQDGEKWVWHEENGNQIFDANVDHTTVKTNDLQKVIVARYIRICPVEWHCWPCLRIEVYGAPLKEGGTEVKTVSYVTEQVVVNREEKEEIVPKKEDETQKGEDAIKFILSQTGDKRRNIEEQKKLIDDEMKQLEDERKKREKRKEEERKQMEEEERKKEEEEEKKREEEQKKKDEEEEERRRKVELEVKKIEEEHKQRLDEIDRKIKEDVEKNRKELEQKKKADEDELKLLDDKMKEDQEMMKRHEYTRLLYEEKMKELQSEGIIKSEKITDDGEEKITITKQIVVESSMDDDKDDEEIMLKEKEEMEKEIEELQSEETITTETTTNDDGVETTTITKHIVIESRIDDDERNKDDEEIMLKEKKEMEKEIEELQSKETITTETTTNDDGVETTTITKHIVVESRIDDDNKDVDDEEIRQKAKDEIEKEIEELQSEGTITTETTTNDDGVETTTITKHIVVESRIDDDNKDVDDEKRMQEKKEREKEREGKIRRILEDEEKRQKEEKDFNELMLQMRIKAEGEDDDRNKKKEEEERKKKEEAKKIKEKEEKQRMEREEKKKMKDEEKAKRRAERVKKKILIETRKTGSTDSLSSLSSSSSSSLSSEEENDQSKVEKRGFRAPIASVDEEEEGVSKVVTYRTHTTTTTRIVSWPGTYFFKPIEPGDRQQTLPEDVGLLFGIENIKPYKGMSCCDHLKPIDPAVKTAQEISFEEKLSDNKGPLPSWIDKETPLQLYTPINAIGDEDIDKLVEWEKAGTKGWKRIKKSRDYGTWTRKAYEGGPPIVKAIITFNGVPYADAINIIRDWETRQDWDKTFDKVTVLDTIDTSRLVYCPVKKRELFLAIQDRQDTNEQYYASAWKNTAHSKINNKNKQLKLYYLVSGLVIRPIEDGSQMCLLCQVKGSVPSQVKGTFLAANPAKWIDSFKKHHATTTKENTVKEE